MTIMTRSMAAGRLGAEGVARSSHLIHKEVERGGDGGKEQTERRNGEGERIGPSVGI